MPIKQNPTDITSEVAAIDVVKERLVVDSFKMVTGEVLVEKTVDEKEVQVPLETSTVNYTESRIPINRVVESIPSIRTEGNLTIVPVIREEEVVVKRLVLVEEIHLLKTINKMQRTETVSLKEETVNITRN